MQRQFSSHPDIRRETSRVAWLLAILIAVVAMPYILRFLTFLVMKFYEVFVQHRTG